MQLPIKSFLIDLDPLAVGAKVVGRSTQIAGGLTVSALAFGGLQASRTGCSRRSRAALEVVENLGPDLFVFLGGIEVELGMGDVDLDAGGCLDFRVGGFVVGRVSGLVWRPGLSDTLGFGLLLLSLLQLVGEPVDSPPETTTQNTENEEVDAVGSGEESGEKKLESTEGDVGG